MTRAELMDALGDRERDFQRDRCPRAAKLLDDIGTVLNEVLPAWPEAGSPDSVLKDWFERAVVAIGYDLDRGVEVSSDDEAFARQKIREARA